MPVIDFLRRILDRILLIEDDSQDDEDRAEFEPAETELEDGVEDDDGRQPGMVGNEAGRIHMMRKSRSDCSGMPVVLARPKNMEDATAVADRVKDRVPIVMNLEGVDESVARRVVDFVGGVVFALDGELRKAGRAVYVCSPVDIPVEDLKSDPQRKRTSLFDLGVDEAAQQIAL
jgi:cell division inhibitor SepF